MCYFHENLQRVLKNLCVYVYFCLNVNDNWQEGNLHLLTFIFYHSTDLKSQFVYDICTHFYDTRYLELEYYTYTIHTYFMLVALFLSIFLYVVFYFLCCCEWYPCPRLRISKIRFQFLKISNNVSWFFRLDSIVWIVCRSFSISSLNFLEIVFYTLLMSFLKSFHINLHTAECCCALVHLHTYTCHVCTYLYYSI